MRQQLRYFGTKMSTREFVYQFAHGIRPVGSICDAFGGVGNIGSFFKSRGYEVWSGDILKFAHCFQVARIERDRNPSFRGLLNETKLNSVNELVRLLNRGPPVNGWIVREFAKKRGFFSIRNAGRIDRCRKEISDWSRRGLLTESEQDILLASLINSVDKVANTAGTYYAYLKKWDRRAIRPFSFELIPCTVGNKNCHSYLEDAELLVSRRSYEILYLDPPHNQRDYAKYYHLPETLALGQSPAASGMSGQPLRRAPISGFNKKESAVQALQEILEKASFKLLIFHYSDQGLIPREKILNILGRYGRVRERTIESLGYTTRHQERLIKHRLYAVTSA